MKVGDCALVFSDPVENRKALKEALNRK